MCWKELILSAVVAVIVFIILDWIVYYTFKIVSKARKYRCFSNPGLDIYSTKQEDTRDAATRARVKTAFSEQWQAMQARAMKAHDPSCKDPLTCIKDPCFIPEPDKIISVRKVKLKSKGQREKELAQRIILEKKKEKKI